MKRIIIRASIAIGSILSIVGIRQYLEWNKQREIAENFDPTVDRRFTFKAYNAYGVSDQEATLVMDETFIVKAQPTLSDVIVYFSKNISKGAMTIGDRHSEYGYKITSIKGLKISDFNYSYWSSTSSTHRDCIGDGNSVSERKNSCRFGIDNIIFNSDDIENEFTFWLTRWN